MSNHFILKLTLDISFDRTISRPERDPSLHQTFADPVLVSFGITGWFYIWVEEGAVGRRLSHSLIMRFLYAACRPFLFSFPGNLCHAASEASLYMMQKLSNNVVISSSTSEGFYETIPPQAWYTLKQGIALRIRVPPCGRKHKPYHEGRRPYIR